MANNTPQVGVVGIGIVGQAVEHGFKLKNIPTRPYDKYKNIGKFEDILDTDIIILCLPTNYSEELQEYDKTAIDDTCQLLENNSYQGLVVIKSTVEPQTTRNLAQKYKIKLIHNPEFLSAKTNLDDFVNQTHVIIGVTNNINREDVMAFSRLMMTCFPNAKLSLCSSDESEMMKIAINSFYSVKIQYFNELYALCEKQNINFDKVRDLMIDNNWINPMHTLVPGTDGKLSYGGMCFPKDTNALVQYMKRADSMHGVLEATIKERNGIRDD